jgi:hypothetical protein
MLARRLIDMARSVRNFRAMRDLDTPTPQKLMPLARQAYGKERTRPVCHSRNNIDTATS